MWHQHSSIMCGGGGGAGGERGSQHKKRFLIKLQPVLSQVRILDLCLWDSSFFFFFQAFTTRQRSLKNHGRISAAPTLKAISYAFQFPADSLGILSAFYCKESAAPSVSLHAIPTARLKTRGTWLEIKAFLNYSAKANMKRRIKQNYSFYKSVHLHIY